MGSNDCNWHTWVVQLRNGKPVYVCANCGQED